MAISNSTDRFNGVLSTLAIKAPCAAVAIANITLSGEQTVNGVAVVSGDRVLVTAQTSAVDNGIYDASSSAWTRSADFNGNRDIVSGTFVTVATAIVGRNPYYQVTTANPITIGNTEINFTLADGPNVSYALTPAEDTAGLTDDDIVDSFEPGHLFRYGCIGDGVAIEDTALQRAFTYAASSNNHLYGPEGTFLTSTPMTATARVKLRGEGWRRTIFKDDGSNVDFMNAAFPVEMEGACFDGYTNAFEFVEVATRTGYEFLRCEFKNLTRGLYASEANSIGIKDFTVDFCRFDTIVQYGIYLEPETLSNVLISNSNFRTIGTTGTAVGVRLGNNTIVADFKDTYKVINNDFLDITTSHATAETHAIIVYADDGRVIITGNTIKNISNGGTSGCEGIYTKARWHVVANNTLEDAGKIEGAINIKGSARSESTSPQGYGGVVHDNVVVFVTFTVGTVGIAINNENINVHDNHVEGASLYGYDFGKPSGCKVHHNTACGGGGADDANPYRGFNIVIGVACDNLEIDDNTVEGFVYTGTGLAVGFNVQNNVATVASSIKIRDNTSKNNAFASGTYRAIQLNASNEDFEDPVITGNEIEQATVGVKLTGVNNILRLRLAENRMGAGVVSEYEINVNDTLAGTVIAETPTVLADDATPSIKGAALFVTGGTTPITNFDDGVLGQKIEILSEHAITITDGTNVILNGSVDFVMAASDSLTLRLKADEKWYETSRMVNL